MQQVFLHECSASCTGIEGREVVVVELGRVRSHIIVVHVHERLSCNLLVNQGFQRKLGMC